MNQAFEQLLNSKSGKQAQNANRIGRKEYLHPMPVPKAEEGKVHGTKTSG